MAFWFGDTASSTALFGVGTFGKDLARGRGGVVAEVAEVHREAGLGLRREPYFSASSRRTRSSTGNG